MIFDRGNTEAILNEVAARLGWSEAEKLEALIEYIDNQCADDAFRAFLEEGVEDDPEGSEPDADGEVRCKFCGKPCEDAYRHQGGWVGACCWDERLRATE
jgi:hypothetical protein